MYCLKCRHVGAYGEVVLSWHKNMAPSKQSQYKSKLLQTARVRTVMWCKHIRRFRFGWCIRVTSFLGKSFPRYLPCHPIKKPTEQSQENITDIIFAISSLYILKSLALYFPNCANICTTDIAPNEHLRPTGLICVCARMCVTL